MTMNLVDLVDLVDLVCVGSIVAVAVGFIGVRFRSPRPPACHSTGPVVDDAPQVVLGASLAKGLRKAQRRARSNEKRVNA